MAAPTMISAATMAGNRHHWLLEDQAIVNQTANTATIVKAVTVPDWAEYATFYLEVTLVAGTTGLLDFKLESLVPLGPDAVFIAPFADWNGITQITNTTNQLVVVDCGPGITGIADDDTGSATASCRYALNAPLPRHLLYTITTDGTTDDEDYTFRLLVTWR